MVACPEFEVLGAVVAADSVAVVDEFVSGEWPSEVACHHKSVLLDLAVVTAHVDEGVARLEGADDVAAVGGVARYGPMSRDAELVAPMLYRFAANPDFSRYCCVGHGAEERIILRSPDPRVASRTAYAVVVLPGVDAALFTVLALGAGAA
jgi:hypothetical protein